MKRWLAFSLIAVMILAGMQVFAAESEDGLLQTAEIYLKTVAAKEMQEQYGKTGELTLSAPMDCYEMTAGYSLWEAYTGHSLSPGYGADEIRVFIVSCDGEPITMMMLRKNDDGIWVLDSLGYAASPVVEASHRLQDVTSQNEEIAFLFSEPNIYPFTPNRYNGYLAVPNMPSSRAIYSTRDALIDYYEHTKDWPTVEEQFKNGENIPMGTTYATIVPSRHYPVWPFWLAVIGIPVAVIALSVGAAILIRRKKHAK